MGCALAGTFPVARRTFEEADDHLGFALSRLCADGPADQLARTEHAQPAIVAASVAAWRVLRETAGVAPAAVAGHSVGEWSALVAAGALDFGTAVRGVRERGRLMQEALPVGVGGMAAVMGLDADAVATLCRAASADEVVVPATLNGAGQVVVSGHVAAVDRVVALAREQGAKAQRLDVTGAFHSPLMGPAAQGLQRLLAEATIAAPEIPVVTSVAARAVRGPDDVREVLVAQLTAPVRWDATAAALRDFAPTLALEPGPGQVLSGLWKRAHRDVRAIPVGDPDGVRAAAEALG